MELPSLKGPARTSPPNSLRTASVLLVIVPLLAVIFGKWLDLKPPAAASIAGVVGVSLGFLLVLLAAVSSAFPNSRHAFGMPPGSVRALIAFVILFSFVALTLVLIDKLGPNNRAAAIHQTIGALATLVTAVAAFYFGSKSVESGAAAFATATGLNAPRGPEAITKGATPDRKTLKGNVNPHGHATRYYFEYTAAASDAKPKAYDASTAPEVLAAGDAAVEVSATLETPITVGAWFRIVAFNSTGSSDGRPQKIGGD